MSVQKTQLYVPVINNPVRIQRVAINVNVKEIIYMMVRVKPVYQNLKVCIDLFLRLTLYYMICNFNKP